MIKLRQITKNDWKFIRQVENQNRQAMHQTKQIPKKTHIQFMNMVSKNPDYHYWVVIVDNRRVGIARLYKTDVGIALLKKFVGKGIGTKTYRLLFTKAKKLGLKKLDVEIKVNLPFVVYPALKVGFKMIGVSSKNHKPYCYALEYDLMNRKRR